MPPAGNWLRFSGSIPPSFVLSHNMPMINIAGKLASFWRFSLTASFLSSHSLATDNWLLATVPVPLTTCHWPLFLRLTPHQRGQVARRPSPTGYCLPPTTELLKTERGPISTSGLSVSVCHRIGRSLRASQSFPPRSPPLPIVFGTVSACCPSLHIQRLPVNLICLIFI